MERRLLPDGSVGCQSVMPRRYLFSEALLVLFFGERFLSHFCLPRFHCSFFQLTLVYHGFTGTLWLWLTERDGTPCGSFVLTCTWLRSLQPGVPACFRPID